MNIIKKILITVIALTTLIAIAGFLILPAVLKPVLTGRISESLRRETSIEQIKINPFALSVTLRGLKIADPGKTTPFVAFDELYVNAGFIMSIFRRALILEEIRLETPYIGITRNPDGTYSFSDLLPKDEPKKEEPAKPFLFSLNNIQIKSGHIDFHDLPNKTDHTVRDLQLAIPFVSNIEYYVKNYVEPKFSAIVNGHTFAAYGKTIPFESSRATSFDIHLKDVDIPYYMQYVPLRLNFKLTSARLDANLKINFLVNHDQSTALTITGNTALKKVALDDLQGNKILRLPALTVNLASIEPFIPKVHLANVTLDAPELVLRRDKKGEINLATLVQPHKKEDPEKPKTTGDAQTPPDGRTDDKKALILTIDTFLIDKADITFMDAQPTRPVNIRIAPLRLLASKLSLNKGESATVDLALTLDKKANIGAKGTVGLNPLWADLALDIKNVAIRPFQPYFTESIQLDVTRGSISTTGQFTLKMDKQNKPGIKYAGNLAIHQLATLDRIHAHDFLKFKKLSFDSLAAGYNPLFVNIREISISDFFAKIVINEGGSTNIQDIFSAENKQPDTPKTTPEKEAPQQDKKAKPGEPPPDIKIGKVSFAGGTVDFADRNIKPNYTVTMLNLKGSVTGLSSQEISRAKVNLNGNLGYGSPIDIAGTINPLTKDLFADIKVNFKDLEMSQVTPYTSKYLGYPVTKGKLNFEVSYLVDKRKLSAENKVFFDQLTFGDKVESPDAIPAPVTLAVSLLTDRNGQINLDIPVSGSLDDPKFKIWPIVWQILVNLITKAVTSPFSLLASITGGGEEMSFVEFDYGSARLPEAGQKKVNALSKVLYDRPNLKLEIEGYIDATGDKGALRAAEFDRLLKSQKLKEIIDKGQTSAIDDIQINLPEYEKYLTLAYKAGDFPKPRTAVGLLKTLPPPEMEKLIKDHINITDSDINQLAARRSQAVREQLLQEGKIEPSRIFLVKPQSLTPAQKEKAKDSRVEFKLK
jgi:uncharacterized protein involved in outer membrane biogenesis